MQRHGFTSEHSQRQVAKAKPITIDQDDEMMTKHTEETEQPILSFDQLLAEAAARGHGNRLLIVLVCVDGAEGGSLSESGGGTLSPVMAASFDIPMDTDLQGLIAEADAETAKWQLLMTAVLPGLDGQPRSEQEVDHHLSVMVERLQKGPDLNDFLFFDRSGGPVWMRPRQS